MHVFSDLMPYICTFDGCQHKLRSFPSRSSWADHEFQEHRLNRYWACPECSRKCCSTLDWEHHLDDVHKQKFSGPDLVAARINARHISPKRAEEEQCPLCQVVLGKPRRAFVKHVSRHMEDIALMALPSNAEEDSETGSINTNHASVEDNDASKDLHSNRDNDIKCIAGFGDDNGNTMYSERYNTDDDLILGSPGVERPFVLHSRSPDDSPPAERSPTPERMSILKSRERRRRPKARASQGDAVRIGFMGGLKHPDLASKAGEEPLSQESDESADEDGTSLRDNQAGEEPFFREIDESADGNVVGSGYAPDAFEWLHSPVYGGPSGASLRDHGYGAADNKSPETPYLETPNRSDKFMQHASVSIDGKLQVRRPQKPVNVKRKRGLTPAEMEAIKMKRKTGACSDCRKAKRKVSVLAGSRFSTVTNTCLVYTCPARRLNES